MASGPARHGRRGGVRPPIPGGAVIDADRLGHAVLDLPAVQASLARSGGGDRNGCGSRTAASTGGRWPAVVFADPAERLALEAVVFPPITALARGRIAAARADPAVRFVVLDAPTLLEAGWGGLADHLVYVDAPRAERLRRVAGRVWTDADLAAREAAQWPADRKRAACGRGAGERRHDGRATGPGRSPAGGVGAGGRRFRGS